MRKGKKIFISHSSKDEVVGEKLFQALVNMGISDDDIFYSSKYHTVVHLGQNFNEIVKENLLSAEIFIFILTEDFYKSSYCMGEMGAAWVLEKEILPILVGDLRFCDMKGFIGKSYIAFRPRAGNAYRLFFALFKYRQNTSERIDIDAVFADFIDTAAKLETDYK